jgi:hypothetical protein
MEDLVRDGAQAADSVLVAVLAVVLVEAAFLQALLGERPQLPRAKVHQIIEAQALAKADQRRPLVDLVLDIPASLIRTATLQNRALRFTSCVRHMGTATDTVITTRIPDGDFWIITSCTIYCMPTTISRCTTTDKALFATSTETVLRVNSVTFVNTCA